MFTLLDRVPWYIKYPIILMFVPITVKDWFTHMARSEAQSIVAPLKLQHDIEMNHVKDNLTNISNDLRDIKNHLMGPGK